jgi:hypothetical protein
MGFTGKPVAAAMSRPADGRLRAVQSGQGGTGFLDGLAHEVVAVAQGDFGAGAGESVCPSSPSGTMVNPGPSISGLQQVSPCLR